MTIRKYFLSKLKALTRTLLLTEPVTYKYLRLYKVLLIYHGILYIISLLRFEIRVMMWARIVIQALPNLEALAANALSPVCLYKKVAYFSLKKTTKDTPQLPVFQVVERT